MTNPIIDDLRKSQVEWLMQDPSERTLNVQGGRVVRGYWHHGADSIILNGNDLPDGYEDMDVDEVYDHLITILEERLEDEA